MLKSFPSHMVSKVRCFSLEIFQNSLMLKVNVAIIYLHFSSVIPRIPTSNYMFKVNDRNTKARYEICSNLTIKITKRRQWRRSGAFIVYFEHISHLVLVFLLLSLSR